jgi:hypothetical protein
MLEEARRTIVLSVTNPRDSKEQTMKKPAFVPRPDMLETRIALSGGTQFTATGAAILHKQTLAQTYSLVQNAFSQYMNHGQNVKRLEANLANAVGRIPFNKRDGLLSAVESEVTQMRFDIRAKVATPIKNAVKRTINDVSTFVTSEVADNIIVLR